MRVTVCVRQGIDGELNPFDAAAYEAALRLPEAEVTLLSMGPSTVRELLLRLTRLGARRAVLLSDPAFAGADTLATAYALSMALQRIPTDLVLCGRQTLVGDTGQTGPMLSALAGLVPITNVMEILSVGGDRITCRTRDAAISSAPLPALLTVERIYELRRPSIRSRMGEVEVLTAADVNADTARCGLTGSPTRVIKTTEYEGGRRKCRLITPAELSDVVEEGLAQRRVTMPATPPSESTLRVLTVGDMPLRYARSVAREIRVLKENDEDRILNEIVAAQPDAVLWGSDSQSKLMAARVAARLGLGLCADCTSLEVVEGTLVMIRPALAGSLMARIKSRTRPAMATVRTTDAGEAAVLLAAGYGARNALDTMKALAKRFSGELAASRKLVDHGLLPYDMQVGLTGKSVSPAVYVAVGISGAVHHLVGMQRAGTVIAINPDRHAPIFDYADYGILATAEELASLL